MNLETTEKKTLHIYCRVSSSKQLRGYSLEMQEKAGIARAEALGYNYELFIERGKSADDDNTLKRPELQRLLKLCDDKKVTDLFVTEIDRFARRINLIIDIDRTFQDNDITIHAGNLTLNMRDPEQRFQVYFQALLGERENIIKTKRSGRSMEEVVRRGKWQGAMLPYGYRRNADKLIEVDPGEAKWYKTIVALCLRNKGTNFIAKYLNHKKVETRGKKVLLNGTKVTNKHTGETRQVKNEDFIWRAGTVYCILKNSIYIGKRRYKDKIIECPSIISEAQWNEVQIALTKKKGYSSNKLKHYYALRGKLRCGRCGRNLCGRNKPKEGEHVYFCLSKRYESCGLRSPNIFRLEALVWEQIVNCNEHLQKLKKDWKENDTVAELKTIEKEISSLKRKQKVQSEEQEMLVELFMKKRITLESFDSRNSRCSELRATTDARIKKLEKDKVMLDGKRVAIETALRNVNYIKDDLEKMSREDKQSILDELIDNIIVYWDPEVNMHFVDVYFKIEDTQYLGELFATPPGYKNSFTHSKILPIGNDEPPPMTTPPHQRSYDADF